MQLRLIGDTQAAYQRLKDAYLRNPGSPTLAVEWVKELIARDDLQRAEQIVTAMLVGSPTTTSVMLINLLASAYLDKQRAKEAIHWLNRLPQLDTVEEAIQAAIQEKRAGRMERAHRYFQIAGDAVMNDPKALVNASPTWPRKARSLPRRTPRMRNCSAPWSGFPTVVRAC